MHLVQMHGQESILELSPLLSRCFATEMLYPFQNNVKEKLKEYGFPSQVAEEFVADIFWKVLWE